MTELDVALVMETQVRRVVQVKNEAAVPAEVRAAAGNVEAQRTLVVAGGQGAMIGPAPVSGQ